jgi:hypothetical protein
VDRRIIGGTQWAYRGAGDLIRVEGNRLIDEYGRTLLLRGVNLGGSSKVPTRPQWASWNPDRFFQHRDVSFVGRPFPLEEADEHLGRLREWGFTFVRLLTTWEAIEHSGPGIYDQEYLDYLRAVVEKMAEHSIDLFIDPHQDVWSRFSGGDGAPGWTFEVVGLDITKFQQTGAAIVHATHSDPLPCMIWPSNYGKLANLTMWTLFFGGNDFAPQTTVDGVGVQEFLQHHYVEAVRQVAQKLKGLPNVVGYDTMNEPSAGLIGIGDLRRPAGLLLRGDSPSPIQAMLLGSGYPQEVETWETDLRGVRQVGSRPIDPQGATAWLEGCEPVWRRNGVWDIGEAGQARLLRPDHFADVRGRRVDFYRDYFRPFANQYAEAIRSVHPEAIILVEGIPGQGEISWTAADAPNVVHAVHWYDALTLLTKGFRSWITYDSEAGRLVLGANRVRKALSDQIAALIRVSEERMGGVPTLVGEVGIPFDMGGKKAYRTGDFSLQARALDATMRALEANLASFTLWNYTADNTHERGDLWNEEDLSIFSRDDQTGSGGIHDGGRALEAAVRPYASRTAGRPLRMSFDVRRRVFQFEFEADAAVAAPTELYVPNYHYPEGYSVVVSDGEYEARPESQKVIYRHGDSSAVHRIVVKPRRKRKS